MVFDTASEFVDTLVDRASLLYVDRTLTYHNWDHIQHAFASHRKLFGFMSPEEELAIAYHDVVYVPGAGDGVNEDLSAIVFKRQHRTLEQQRGVKSTINTDLVLGIIDATKVKNHLSHHLVVGDFRIARVLDCDLAGLGSSYTAFVERQSDIIFEIAGAIGNGEHREARRKSAEFLAQFLAKPTIYLTQQGQEAFEEQARSNIQRYMKEHG